MRRRIAFCGFLLCAGFPLVAFQPALASGAQHATWTFVASGGDNSSTSQLSSGPATTPALGYNFTSQVTSPALPAGEHIFVSISQHTGYPARCEAGVGLPGQLPGFLADTESGGSCSVHTTVSGAPLVEGGSVTMVATVTALSPQFDAYSGETLRVNATVSPMVGFPYSGGVVIPSVSYENVGDVVMDQIPVSAVLAGKLSVS